MIGRLFRLTFRGLLAPRVAALLIVLASSASAQEFIVTPVLDRDCAKSSISGVLKLCTGDPMGMRFNHDSIAEACVINQTTSWVPFNLDLKDAMTCLLGGYGFDPMDADVAFALLRCLWNPDLSVVTLDPTLSPNTLLGEDEGLFSLSSCLTTTIERNPDLPPPPPPAPPPPPPPPPSLLVSTLAALSDLVPGLSWIGPIAP